MRRPLSAAILLAALAGCSGPAPQPARVLDPAPAVAELHDGLRAHYSLVPTLALGEAVARQYGIRREDGTALLVVALRQRQADDEVPASGQVRAQARNLAGQRQQVQLREVGTGDYRDHIGLVRVGERDQIRIEATVLANGRSSSFSFERGFF